MDGFIIILHTQLSILNRVPTRRRPVGFQVVRFSDLGIESRLVGCLADRGITEPFEVQIEAIPSAMEGRDICLSLIHI